MQGMQVHVTLIFNINIPCSWDSPSSLIPTFLQRQSRHSTRPVHIPLIPGPGAHRPRGAISRSSFLHSGRGFKITWRNVCGVETFECPPSTVYAETNLYVMASHRSAQPPHLSLGIGIQKPKSYIAERS